MQITIQSVDPKKIDLIHCAVLFYAKILFHGNTLNVLNISIKEMTNSEKKKWDGYAEWDSESGYVRPRDFIISINSRRSKRNVLETIAHEMIHVFQFVNGDLKHRFIPKMKIYWKEEEININDFEYENLPYEIEATLFENILATEFEEYYDNF